MRIRNRWPGALVSGLLAVAVTAIAGDWTNSGGNAGRNGLSIDTGPTEATVAWSGGRSSLIAWHPVTEGNRVFMVRQPRWPYQQPDDAFIVAMDLQTGAELWAEVLPYETDDWIPWIAGARDGKVYASRAGNGASVSARMFALDAATGDIVWTSVDDVDAGAYDGVVFAPDGDLLVASFRDIWRIDAADGSTVWHATRTGSVSGSCGGARYGDAFYVADAAPGGHVLVRYDVATGARMYQSPLMSGFTIQNTPFVGPDGTVYLNRAQNNAGVDFYYAFTDDGPGFVERWHVPGMGGANAEFGIGPDGSVYVIVPGPRLARLEPVSGGVLDQTDVLAGFSKARLAIDAAGKVFFSNGAFETGRLYSFDADLTARWDVPVTNINIGGPSIGDGGMLVVCGVGADVRAYRTGSPVDVAIVTGNGGRVLSARPVPNPFVEATEIRYELARAGRVSLDIFDVRGSRVRSLVSSEPGSRGMNIARWDGRDEIGEALPPGVYYYRLDVEGAVDGGRMLLTR